jgi:hypothetical protein
VSAVVHAALGRELTPRTLLQFFSQSVFQPVRGDPVNLEQIALFIHLLPHFSSPYMIYPEANEQASCECLARNLGEGV